MGVRNLDRISTALVEAGRSPDEPAAVISRGTLSSQRTVGGTLADIAEQVAEEGLSAPAVTVVGPVTALRAALGWLERRPLFGRTVVVTRAREQASVLSRRLAELGADVVEAPAIRIVPRESEELDRAVAGIERYALVCLTSPNGVRLFAEALMRRGRDARALAGAKVATIGPGTAEALAGFGIGADVVPERSVAEALVEELAAVPVEGRPVLIARAAGARDVLPDALRERGAEVDVVALYETVADPLAARALQAADRADYVTFTSSSTVRFFLEALGDRSFPEGARVVSIGPITSQTAQEFGLEVHVEAKHHDIDGLVEALLADATQAAPA